MRLLYLVILLIPLWGCQTMVFGVSEERWNTLSESEREAVIGAYNERQRLREETNRANAEARLAAARRLDDIHNGSGGYFGDLIRVVMTGGTMKIRGTRRRYQPFVVELADGETALVKVYREDKGHVFDTLHIAYRDRVLLIESDAGSVAMGLPFKPKWQRGRCYEDIDTRGRMKLRNVGLFVKVIPYSRAGSGGGYVQHGPQFARRGCGGGGSFANAPANVQPAQPSQGYGQQPQIIIIPVPQQQQQQQQQVIIVPGQPAQPAQPARPAQPAQPAQPARPAQPAQPAPSAQPAQPAPSAPPAPPAQQPQASQPAPEQPQASQPEPEQPQSGGLLGDAGAEPDTQQAPERRVACLLPSRNDERGADGRTVTIPRQACLGIGGTILRR